MATGKAPKKSSKAKEKKDPLIAALANIEKRMGHNKKAGSVCKSPFARFGDIERVNVPVIPFGIKDIDDATYCGGIPRGKMMEIFGNESSGKSLLSLFLIREAQKQGLNCALIDVEQSFDPNWAAMHGVDIDKLIYANTFDGAGEEALEYAYRLCQSGAVGLVVVDSTAALTPIAEIEGSLEDNERVGAQARMMSRGCRKICNACGQTNTTCVFINQIRMKIGVKFGNPETTPGGKALPFYSHVRAKVSKIGKIKVTESGEEIVVGQKSRVQFIKNKTARPWGQAEFQIVFDEKSLNPVVMLSNLLRTHGVISSYKGILNISKQTAIDLYDGKKGIPTGATTMLELADWLIENDKIVELLDYLLQEIAEDDALKIEVGKIDDAILELKEDPSKIVSPTGNVSVAANKIGDVPEDEREPEPEPPKDIPSEKDEEADEENF